MIHDSTGEVLLKCPICDSEKVAEVSRNGKFKVYSCADCEHKFVADAVRTDSLVEAFYQGLSYWWSNYYHQGIRSLSGEEEWESYISDRFNVLVRHKVIEEQPTGPCRCMEIGCAEGKFLAFLEQKGFQVIGCEVNRKVVEWGRKHFGLEITTDPIETSSFDANSFDAICSYHTFEHLVNPVAVLAKCHHLLRVGGKILLELPCDDGELDNMHHLHFFSPKSASVMFDRVFHNAHVEDNSYVTSTKQRMGSLYISGEKLADKEFPEDLFSAHPFVSDMEKAGQVHATWTKRWVMGYAPLWLQVVWLKLLSLSSYAKDVLNKSKS
jgi:SAM-dependent methyltransferase